MTERKPVRVLFLINHSLGWKTLARHMEHAATRRPGVVATFCRLGTSTLDKVLARPLPVIGRPLRSDNDLMRDKVRREVGPGLRRGDFDVLFSTGQGLALVATQLMEGRQIPLAISLDTTGTGYERDLMGRAGFDPCTAVDENAIFHRAELLMPWSNWAGRSLEVDYGVSPGRIRVVPPCSTPVEVSRADGYDSRSAVLPKILFVGNDFDRKGGPDLVRYHQTALATKAELHICSAKAPRSLAGANLFNHGPVDNVRLTTELMPSCDVFCLPTRHDMSPFVLTEAQHAGLPCVSSLLAGIPDQVIHEQTGLLARPGDHDTFVGHLTRLVTDHDLRRRMSLAARAHARTHLSAPVVYPALLDALSALARPA